MSSRERDTEVNILMSFVKHCLAQMLVVAAALVAGESIFVTFTCLSCDGLDLTV